MSGALALQKAVRAALAADPAVTALVPAGNIFDRSARPETFPCVILGEGQELPAGKVATRFLKLHSTFHVWTREAGTTSIKAISAAVRKALDGTYPALDGARCHELRFTGTRFMRDPDGASSHAVMSFEAVVEELS